MNYEGTIEFPKVKTSYVKVTKDPADTIQDDQDSQCYVCGKVSKFKKDIIEHIKEKHFPKVKKSMYGPPREHQCTVCHLVFSTNGALGTVLPTMIFSKLDFKICISVYSKFSNS